MRRMGVLGGMSAQATMDFEARVHRCAQRLIPQDWNRGYPPMVVWYHRQLPILRGDDGRPLEPRQVDPQLVDAAARLGTLVDFLVVPCNAAHVGLREIREAAGCPVLSMIDVAVDEVVRRKCRRVGVLGANSAPPPYVDALRQRDIACEQIDAALQAPLDAGIRAVMEGADGKEETEAARAAVGALRARAVEAVVLGCTEIPLLLRDESEAADLINPVALLAEAAVRFAIEDAEERMMRTDLAGLAVSTTSTDALASYERGVDLFLRWRAGSMEALEAAEKSDPRFALSACTRAYIAWRMGRVDLADAAARQAVALADAAHSERERLHVQAVDAMRRGEFATTYQLLERIVAEHPTDRMAVRVVGLNCITQGDYRRGIDIARRSLEASPGETQYETMLGFFLEQSGYNDEGLEMSLRSLAKDPTNLYTYHAVGHAYQARGDYRSTLETFSRATSLERYAHLLWHLAEAHAILGEARMTRDYWASTVPPLPLYERIELLWRLEVLRHTRTDDAIWQDLARQAERTLEHADFLTTWMHHWIGVAFARVGDWDKATQQLERLRRLPEGRASGHWSTLGAALLEGEMAIIKGDDATAVRLMAPAVERIDMMGGGSREQKDIFRDVFLELHRRLGHVEQVIALAQQRLLANPCHLPSLAALNWAYERNGNAALQRQAARQLVLRAQEVGCPADAPEVLAARKVLEVAA